MSEDKAFLSTDPLQRTLVQLLENPLTQDELLVGRSQALQISDSERTELVLKDLIKKTIIVEESAPFHQVRKNYFELETITIADTVVTLVSTGTFLDPRIDNISRDSDTKVWFPMKLLGSRLMWGPLMGGAHHQCWACVTERLKKNHFTGPFVETIDFSSVPVRFDQESFELTRSAGIAWLRSKLESPINDRHPLITEYVPRSVELIEHPLLMKHLCPACQIKNTPVSETRWGDDKLQLRSPRKNYRSLTAEETLKNIGFLENDLTGLMPKMQKLKGILSESLFYGNGHMGKGQDETTSKVACIAEALERYVLTRPAAKSLYSAFEQLKQEAVHPNELMGLSLNQYRQKKSLQEFDDDLPIHWTTSWSTKLQKVVLVPTGITLLNHIEEHNTSTILTSSNGCASGNTQSEAALFGLLELIERDCIGLWWYNKLRRAPVDLAKINDEFINKMLLNSKNNGLLLHVLDITSDIGVPCFAAISYQPDGSFINAGFGCHPDVEIALTGAICELNQSIGSIREASKLTDPVLKEWLLKANIFEHPYLLPNNEPRNLGPCAHNPIDYHEPEAALVGIIHRIHSLGYDVIIQDLSFSELPLKVVRVISPGLCHHKPRFRFPRLFSTPVSIGLLDHELKEEELNEQPFPY